MMLTFEAVVHVEPASVPVFSDAGPDAKAYGAAKGFPVPPVGQPPTQKFMVGWYSHCDRLTPTRAVPKLDAPMTAASTPSTTISTTTPVMGLMIARDNSVLVTVRTAVRTEDRGPKSAEVMAL